eukprot:CAMPEP_0196656536 /NCGR_PEP_ID=MMETSP1086-20130531/17625_1 /TAXON_ID=77921 /ORGANISM="Cyanoptyche  gloeocystis , Strain SAG4.97" /LENGTH=233 /DNA_ID=CAMNT_0041989313 /DNA_START=84 /DNA_END=785 /DNA_ORIENTATION=-
MNTRERSVSSSRFVASAYVFTPVALRTSTPSRLYRLSPPAMSPQQPQSTSRQDSQLQPSTSFFISADTPSLVNQQDQNSESGKITWHAKLLYDGDCPVCIRNVEMLQKLDRQQRVDFVDIASPFYEPEEHGGVELEEAMERMTAVLSNGRIVQNMDAIRAIYRAMGLGWLVAPTGWPILRTAFDQLYDFVSSNRYTLLGQKMCDAACSLAPKDDASEYSVQPAPVKQARSPRS